MATSLYSLMTSCTPCTPCPPIWWHVLPSFPNEYLYFVLFSFPYLGLYSVPWCVTIQYLYFPSPMATCTPFPSIWIPLLTSTSFDYLNSLLSNMSTCTSFLLIWLSVAVLLFPPIWVHVRVLPSLPYGYLYSLPSPIATCTPFPPLWLPVLPSLPYGYLYSLPSVWVPALLILTSNWYGYLYSLPSHMKGNWQGLGSVLQKNASTSPPYILELNTDGPANQGKLEKKLEK